MAEEVKKAIKAKKPAIDDKAAKEAAKATLQALSKTDVQKAAAVRASSAAQVGQKPEEKAVAASPEVKAVKAAPAKEPVPETKPEAPKAEVGKTEPAKAAPSGIKTEASAAGTKKEADPSKEFVEGIMTEMALKGGSKRRLIKKLAEQFNFDRQKVMFKLKRALISERYAAGH